MPEISEEQRDEKKNKDYNNFVLNEHCIELSFSRSKTGKMDR